MKHEDLDKLSFTYKNLKQLEKLTGENPTIIFSDSSKLTRPSMINCIIRAGLFKAFPTISEKAVDDLIDEIGVKKVMEAVTSAAERDLLDEKE